MNVINSGRMDFLRSSFSAAIGGSSFYGPADRCVTSIKGRGPIHGDGLSRIIKSLGRGCLPFLPKPSIS